MFIFKHLTQCTVLQVFPCWPHSPCLALAGSDWGIACSLKYPEHIGFQLFWIFHLFFCGTTRLCAFKKLGQTHCHNCQGEKWPEHSRKGLQMLCAEISIGTIRRVKQHPHSSYGYNSTAEMYARRTQCFPLVHSFFWISLYFLFLLDFLPLHENTQKGPHIYIVLKSLNLHVSLEQHLLLPSPETSIQGMMEQIGADTTLQPAANHSWQNFAWRPHHGSASQTHCSQCHRVCQHSPPHHSHLQASATSPAGAHCPTIWHARQCSARQTLAIENLSCQVIAYVVSVTISRPFSNTG